MLRPTNDNDNVQYQMRLGSPFSSRGYIAKTLEKIFNTLQNDTEINIANDYKVSPGSKAHIKVQGKPNTKYSISVKYKSGYSEAEGLYSKNSDNLGYVSWNWKVGTKTSEGTYPVTITNEDTFACETFYFSVK